MSKKRKSKKMSETIERNDAINETTKLRSELHAEVNLKMRNKRNARSTEMPNDVPGIKIPKISSITEPMITTKSNTLNELRM